MEPNTSHRANATIRKTIQYTMPEDIKIPADRREVKNPELTTKEKELT